MNIKKVNAKIFDPENDEYRSDIPIEIELVISSDPDEKPHFEVKGIFQEQRLEFNNKNLILELNPSLRGYAFFNCKAVMGCLTFYEITFQDSVWRNIEWFYSL